MTFPVTIEMQYVTQIGNLSAMRSRSTIIYEFLYVPGYYYLYFLTCEVTFGKTVLLEV